MVRLLPSIRRTVGKVTRQVRSRLLVDHGDYRRAVFLAGSGRSGTTWVLDIVNHGNDYRVMFEPFRPKLIPVVSGWHSQQYIRSSDRSPGYVGPATAILTGRTRHWWVDQFNRRRVSDKRLIKDVRAQLFLRWIKQTFPEIPIVLLLRHPCAVASSRLQFGWDAHLGGFLTQPDLIEDFLDPFADEIASCDDEFDRQIWMWCVENYVPLRQFNQGEILVVFYEHLCCEPRKEIDRVLAFVGDRVSAEVLAVAGRPSALSREWSAIRTGIDLVSAWRSNTSGAQVERAVEICARFGLEAIYGAGDMPLVSADEALSVLAS